MLDLLSSLVDKSLVQQVEGADGELRFGMLETIREYGVEQLQESGEAEAVRKGHAHCFLALAEAAEPELAGPDQGHWLDRLEREHDNLRAALAWSLENHQTELGLRLGSALEGFWQPRGHVTEGRAQLLRLLAEPAAAAPPAVRARGLSTAGLLTSVQGDPEDANAYYEESLAIWRRLEDRVGIATVLHHMARVAVMRWDMTTARHLAEESLALRRELGEARGLADTLALMAEICRHEGDLVARRGLLEESITIWQALGDRGSATRGLATLAHWALDAGELDTARRLYEEVLAAATELGDKPGIGWALFGLGEVAHSKQDFAVARGFYERSLPLWRELGEIQGLDKTLFYLGNALRRQGDAAAAYACWAEIRAIGREANRRDIVAEAVGLMGAAAGDLGRWEETAARCAESLRLTSTDEVPRYQLAISWDLIGLARVALARGNPVWAARLLGATEALVDDPIHPATRQEFDGVASTVRGQMAAAEFAAAWAAGQGTPLEQVVAEALEEALTG